MIAKRRPNSGRDGASASATTLKRAVLAATDFRSFGPAKVLAVLVIADWFVIAEAARIAVHRGWLFYDGGDGTWYYTSAWVLGQGHLPQAYIGYGYSLLVAPLTWIAGSNILAGLPLIVLLNAVVLSPIAVLCIFGLAKGIGGQRFAYACASLWVVFPVASIAFFHPDYHSRYVDITLPDVVGLTSVGDFPSMVCGLVAAYFVFRALSSDSRHDALTAGLAAGVMIGIKPANALFLPAAVLALAVARRPHALGRFAVGLAPSLLALVLWKYRGLGNLPLFSLMPAPHLTLASGGNPALPAGSLPVHLGRYLHFNWGTLHANLDDFRRFGRYGLLVLALTLAGLAGLARRSLAGAVLIGGWFAAYLLVKGSFFSINDGDFFTHDLPAAPAFFLMALCSVLLVPALGKRLLDAPGRESWPRSERSRRGVLAFGALLAIIPIGVFVLLKPLTRPSATEIPVFDLYVPADGFRLSARTSAGSVILSWPQQATHGTYAPYFIFRSHADGLTCTPVAHAASHCAFAAGVAGIAPASSSSFRDRPPPGRWSYRVALSATAFGPDDGANPLVLSLPVSLQVRRASPARRAAPG